MSMLEVHEVAKAYGGIQALSACSLSVEQGTITGLIGTWPRRGLYKARALKDGDKVQSLGSQHFCVHGIASVVCVAMYIPEHGIKGTEC